MRLDLSILRPIQRGCHSINWTALRRTPSTPHLGCPPPLILVPQRATTHYVPLLTRHAAFTQKSPHSHWSRIHTAFGMEKRRWMLDFSLAPTMYSTLSENVLVLQHGLILYLNRDGRHSTKRSPIATSSNVRKFAHRLTMRGDFDVPQQRQPR